MQPAVTFETKCWERDWERLLKTDRLRQMVDRNDFPFAERVLMINNVRNFKKVSHAAEQAVRDGRLTRFYRVDDYAAEALKFFGLTRRKLGIAYVYSISELVSVYLCRTEFLLHFAGDCLPAEKHEWISKALAVLDGDPRIKVANLLWYEYVEDARRHSCEETDDFFKGRLFSDHCFLVRASDFRQRIYSHPPIPGPYPRYGGESFEKRVDAWMQANGHLRATYKHAFYLHENLPPTFGRRVRLFGMRIRRSILWRLGRL